MKPPICTISPLQDSLKGVILEELRQEKPRFPLSPSRISTCLRQLSYDLINFKNPKSIPLEEHSVTKLMMFDNGHRAEERIFDWVSKIPNLEVIKDKERFEIVQFDGVSITGELDRILYDKKRKKKFVADAKTINTRGFSDISESLIPKEGNYLQLQSYLAAPSIQAQGISDGMLYYENKDDHRFLLLEFPFNAEAAKFGIERLYRVHKFAGNSLPREFLFGENWQCQEKYCPYHAYCYSSFKQGQIIIDKQDFLLDEYLQAPKGRNLEAIKVLLAYGDAREYKYFKTTFRITELKTTLSLEVLNG